MTDYSHHIFHWLIAPHPEHAIGAVAMHLNPRQPNILHDMQAAANGRDLHNPVSKR